MQVILIVLSTLFAVISPITYAVSIMHGKTKPHRTTRFVLAFVMLMNFLSIFVAHGDLATLVLAGIFAAHGIVIAGFSIRRGMGGSDAFDWICLAIALCGILGWRLSGNPIVGVWFSILADAAAYAPAVLKTWRYPHTESHWLYTTSLIATALSLAASSFGPTVAFQVYIILCDLTLIFCIYHKQLFALDSNRELVDDIEENSA